MLCINWKFLCYLFLKVYLQVQLYVFFIKKVISKIVGNIVFESLLLGHTISIILVVNFRCTKIIYLVKIQFYSDFFCPFKFSVCIKKYVAQSEWGTIVQRFLNREFQMGIGRNDLIQCHSRSSNLLIFYVWGFIWPNLFIKDAIKYINRRRK